MIIQAVFNLYNMHRWVYKTFQALNNRFQNYLTRLSGIFLLQRVDIGCGCGPSKNRFYYHARLAGQRQQSRRHQLM